LDISSIPPIIFVVSGIVTITGINIANRLAVNSIKTRWGVIAANYCMALVLSTAMFAFSSQGTISPFTIVLGLITGFLYIGGMYIGMTTIGRRGASIAISVSQLSVLIPVSLSVAVFGEHLSTMQLIGVAVALISLPLLAAKVGGGLSGGFDRETLLLIVAQIFVQGFAQFSSKVLVATGLGAERSAFFLAVFISATIVTIPIALRHRVEIRRKDLGFGSVVGVFNIGGNLSILLALAALPGAIVFPLVNSGGLLLVTVLSWLIFKERISRVNAIGIALTLAAVLLINL
jgi:drug/metabolite transporter (DMT)-like permease